MHYVLTYSEYFTVLIKKNVFWLRTAAAAAAVLYIEEIHIKYKYV